jgi:hypothetical protein
MPPLAPCSCVRDPLTDRHRCQAQPLTGHQLHAWTHTIEHLAGLGLPAVVPAEVVRAVGDYGLAAGE